MTPEQLHKIFTEHMKEKNFTLMTADRQIKATMDDSVRNSGRRTYEATEADLTAAVKTVLRITTEERDTRQKVLGPNEQRVQSLTHQIEYLNTLLPEKLSDEALAALVDEAIDTLGATSMRDMRNIIAYVTEHATADFDNASISKLVKQRFS